MFGKPFQSKSSESVQREPAEVVCSYFEGLTHLGERIKAFDKLISDYRGKLSQSKISKRQFFKLKKEVDELRKECNCLSDKTLAAWLSYGFLRVGNLKRRALELKMKNSGIQIPELSLSCECLPSWEDMPEVKLGIELLDSWICKFEVELATFCM